LEAAARGQQSAQVERSPATSGKARK
jgi:hypothetical protein